MDTNTQQRIHFLDSLRGFTLIHMVLFHFCYDLVFFAGVDMPWYTGWPGELWGHYIRWSFILISGLVFPMGRRPVRRGLVLMGWGCILTLVTWTVVPEALIRFGILSFLGAASLIAAAVYPYLKRIPAPWGFFCSAVLFALAWRVPQGGLGPGRHIWLNLPEALYQTEWLYWLGFCSENFYSTDYFPIFPWIFLYFIGIFLGEIFQGSGAFRQMGRAKPGKLAFLGRYSLYVYLLHQPVLYGICLFLIRYL